ncbi:hypothetical protein TNCV_2927941 [Trichonephila clavipes]|nr:hypothetical protein TNCV_2927941 [Trichonephila clavipes]
MCTFDGLVVAPSVSNFLLVVSSFKWNNTTEIFHPNLFPIDEVLHPDEMVLHSLNFQFRPSEKKRRTAPLHCGSSSTLRLKFMREAGY